jgi:hypothetical protein
MGWLTMRLGAVLVPILMGDPKMLIGFPLYYYSAVFFQDDFFQIARSLKKSVIPAKAGILFFQCILDPGFRRGDAGGDL